MRRKFLKAYTVFDLILIAMLTAVTIAFKAVAGTLVKMITGPMGIPGGALAGGLYMLWLPLGVALTDKRGAALLISFIQSVVLLISGMPGGHGAWTFLIYLLPALAVEAVMLIGSNKGYNVLHFIAAAVIANIIGTFGSNLLVFRISFLPLMFTLCAAAFSGAVGGVLGYFTFVKISKSGLLNKKFKKDDPPWVQNEDTGDKEENADETK